MCFEEEESQKGTIVEKPWLPYDPAIRPPMTSKQVWAWSKKAWKKRYMKNIPYDPKYSTIDMRMLSFIPDLKNEKCQFWLSKNVINLYLLLSHIVIL